LDNTPQIISEELRAKVSSLQSALLERHPKMPLLLQEIHSALREQPENVTLMSEEEIQVIVQGLQVQTNTFLAETVTKSKGKAGTTARLKNLSEDAF
jgi:hypothetical protein